MVVGTPSMMNWSRTCLALTMASCRVEPLTVPSLRASYTADDLVLRQFLRTASRRLAPAHGREVRAA